MIDRLVWKISRQDILVITISFWYFVCDRRLQNFNIEQIPKMNIQQIPKLLRSVLYLESSCQQSFLCSKLILYFKENKTLLNLARLILDKLKRTQWISMPFRCTDFQCKIPNQLTINAFRYKSATQMPVVVTAGCPLVPAAIGNCILNNPQGMWNTLQNLIRRRVGAARSIRRSSLIGKHGVNRLLNCRLYLNCKNWYRQDLTASIELVFDTNETRVVAYKLLN